MGWFTLKSGYDSTVASAPSGTLTFPVAAFPAAGSSVILTASKTFDTGNPALASSIAWDATCAAYMTQTPGPQPGPGNPAQQTILVKAASLPPSATTCYGTATSGLSYGGTLDPGVRVAVNLPAGVSPLTLEPGSIAMPVSGTALSYVDESALHAPAAIINQLLGGGVALASVGPCPTGAAVAYSNANFTAPIAPGTTLGNELGIDPANGCMDGYGGVSAAGSVVVTRASEPGFNATFSLPPGNTCGLIVQFDGWNPASALGPTALLGLSGTAVGQCSFSVTGASGSSGTQSVNAKVTGGCVPGQPCGAYGKNINSDAGVPCVIRPGQKPFCITPTYSETDNQYYSSDGGFSWLSDGTANCSNKTGCTPSITNATVAIPAGSTLYQGMNSYDSKGGISSGPCSWTPTQVPGTLNGAAWPTTGC